jgi:hypothetical protein
LSLSTIFTGLNPFGTWKPIVPRATAPGISD